MARTPKNALAIENLKKRLKTYRPPTDKQRLSKANEQLDEMRELLDTLETKNDHLVKARDQLLIDKGELQRQIEAVTKHSQAVNKAHADSCRTFDQIEADLKNQVGNLQRVNGNLQANLDDAREKWAAADKARKHAEKDRATDKNLLEHQRAKIDQLERDYSITHSLGREALAKLEVANASIRDLDKTVNELREQLASVIAERDRLRQAPPAAAQDQTEPETAAKIMDVAEARRLAQGMPAIGLKIHVDGMCENSAAIMGRINGVRAILDVRVRDDRHNGEDRKPRRCVDVVVSEAPRNLSI